MRQYNPRRKYINRGPVTRMCRESNFKGNGRDQSLGECLRRERRLRREMAHESKDAWVGMPGWEAWEWVMDGNQRRMG